MNLTTTRLAALTLACLLLSACGHVQPRITESSKVTLDQDVRTSPLHTYAKPRTTPTRGLSALFVPFKVTESMENPRLIGTQSMTVFWQTFMEREVFAVQSLDDDAFYNNRAHVARLARSKGADLAVTGEISHYLHGGSNSDSAVSLRLDIIDAASGDLVWSLAQAGRMERVLTEDYILFRRSYRMPMDAMNLMLYRIASNMADVVHDWSDAHGFATTADDILHGLLRPHRIAAPVNPKAQAEAKAMEYAPDGTERVAVERDPLRGVNLKVEFDFDKWDIRPDAALILDELGKALTSPELAGRSFTLRGHTDSVGTEEYNMRLSLRRAAAVKNYLATKFKIAPELLIPKGFGESMSLAPNDTPENRQLNRRVEVVRNP